VFAYLSFFCSPLTKQASDFFYYYLQAYYLDFLNFGIRNELPLTLPRILVWKGTMIKKFASFDRVCGDKYGKRPVSVVYYIIVQLYDETSICCCF
jgi:hypothetical protein